MHAPFVQVEYNQLLALAQRLPNGKLGLRYSTDMFELNGPLKDTNQYVQFDPTNE
ncbi:hypothetical protein [Herpetosiphon giganteus]|uniref:hypothetical protein n=1 Tax=Herpetosiphon giganteus TaxID=2029754 RepID=UPI00195B8772|nr:hypothetical protein [Herpetosiphon giganteus]MBM7843039.1 hypothetical protein [Herpetosiphon giganteus]